MRFTDLTIAALLLTLAGSVVGAPPVPIFEEDKIAASDEDLRAALKPRPVFVDEPFFQDDCQSAVVLDPIMASECPVGMAHVDDCETPWWRTLGPLLDRSQYNNCQPNDWLWPDQGRAWTARTLATRWSRSGVDGGTLFQNPGVAGQGLSASNFDVNHDGVDAQLILHNFWPSEVTEYDLELRLVYLLQSQANQAALLTGPNTQLNTFPSITQVGDYNIASTLSSDFYTGEINVRHENDNGWWTTLWGVRYVSLNDELSATFVDPGGGATLNYHAHTSNRMWGPQVGANMALWRSNRFCLDATGKVGALWNQSQAITSYDGTSAFTTGESQAHASFMGEIGIMGRYAFAKRWSLVMSAQSLMLYRVAEGPAQLSHTNPTTGTGHEFGSSVIYNAGAIGLEYRY